MPERVPELAKALKTGTPGERVIAAEMLADLGPKAEAAIPALAGVIRDTPHPVPIPPWSQRTWTRDERAAHFLLEATWDALARVGPKAVPAYSDLLAHRDAEVRGRAAEALKALGPAAAEAVPALVKRLGNGENQWVFFNALEALAAIGPKAEAAIPALIQAVLDPRATVPKESLDVDSQKGSHQSEPLRLRQAAAQALVAIGPKALPAVKRDLFPAIILSLADDGRDKYRSPFGSVDERSVWRRFGADAAPLVPALVRVLLRNSKDSLIASLLELGPDGHKALAALLADKREQTRNERFTALCDIRHGFHMSDEGRAAMRTFVPHLLPVLNTADHKVRHWALLVLERYGGTTRPEVVKAVRPLLEDQELLKYLDTGNEDARRTAAELIALWRDPAKPPATVPQLLKDFESDDKERRESALRELQSPRSGPGAQALLPVLRDVATGKRILPGIKPQHAARMAVHISLDPKDVEQLLVPLWAGNDSKSRPLYHFSDLRHLTRPYLKLLFQSLNDPSADIRGYAERTIREVLRTDPVARAAFDKWIIETRYDGPFLKEYKPAASDALKLFQRGKQFDPVRGFRMVRQIGPAAKDAVPYLLPYLADDLDPVMREAVERGRLEPESALSALAAIGPGAKDAVPLIRMQMAHAADDVKPWYMLCLADIGPGAKAAIPDLKELLADPDPMLRLLAACALAKIEGDFAPYRATFAHLIHDRRNCALWKLEYGVESRVVGHIAPDCPELVPVIVRGFVRLGGLYMQGRIDSTPDNVVAVLIRSTAATKAAVPDLVNYLKSTGWRIIPEVVELIGAIGPDAKPALPQLRELLDHWDLELAVAAHGAIQKIEGKK